MLEHVNVEMLQLVEQPIKLGIDVRQMMLRVCACAEMILFVQEPVLLEVV